MRMEKRNGFQSAFRMDWCFFNKHKGKVLYRIYSCGRFLGSDKPRFCLHGKALRIEKTGFTLYYSHQCPFTAKYVPLLEESTKRAGNALETVFIDSKEKAQNAPAAVTNFALFYEGKFISHEILSKGKFEKLVQDKGERK